MRVGLITLLLRPKIEPGGFRLDRFEAYTEAGEYVTTSRRPLLDGARALLALGYDPATLLTVRHEGGPSSFEPKPIGALAEWTVVERDKRGLQLDRWRPEPGSRIPVLPTGKGVRTGEALA